MNTFMIVEKEGHGSLLIVLIIGFVFGAIILYSRLDKFEKMAGFMIFEDTLAIRMAMTTVGLSSIGFYFLVQYGYASFEVKPLMLGGVIVGAVIFGIGLVILGKCPSAFFVSVAEGRIDAFVGVLGGMAGAAVFTLVYPYIEDFMGKNLGDLQLTDYFGSYGWLVTLIFGGVLLLVAYLLPTIEYRDPADFKENK